MMHGEWQALHSSWTQLLCVIALSTGTFVSVARLKDLDMKPWLHGYDAKQWRRVDTTVTQQYSSEPTATPANSVRHGVIIEPSINRHKFVSSAAAATSGRGQDAQVLTSDINDGTQLPWENTLGNPALTVGSGGPQRVPFYVYDGGPFDFVTPCLDAKSYDVHCPLLVCPSHGVDSVVLGLSNNRAYHMILLLQLARAMRTYSPDLSCRK